MSSTARKRVGKTLTALIDHRIANGVLGEFGSQWSKPCNCSTKPRKFGDSAKPSSNPRPMFLKMSLSTRGNYGMVDLECLTNFWHVYCMLITGQGTGKIIVMANKLCLKVHYVTFIVISHFANPKL